MLLLILSFQLIKNIHCSFAPQTLGHQNYHVVSSDNNPHYNDQLLTSVKFLIYPPEENATEINPDNTHLLNTSQPTKILIHGLGAFHDHVWIDQMVSRYHTKGGHNIIVVDWSQITTKDTVYVASAINSVGKIVANFLIKLTQQRVEFLESVHVIGSSVGAQVGAIAGKKVKHSGKGKIDRITGLDPEKPTDLGFLDKNDAVFVDVMHTSYGTDVHGVGTVDIFLISDNEKRENAYNDDGPSAEDIFTTSIDNNSTYVAVACDNRTSYIENECSNNTKIVVGESVPRNISGTYYLTKGSATTFFTRGCNNGLILTGLTFMFFYFIVY